MAKNLIMKPDPRLEGFEDPGEIPSADACDADSGMLVCCLPLDHKGVHQAWGSYDLLATWEDDDPESAN